MKKGHQKSTSLLKATSTTFLLIYACAKKGHQKCTNFVVVLGVALGTLKTAPLKDLPLTLYLVLATSITLIYLFTFNRSFITSCSDQYSWRLTTLAISYFKLLRYLDIKCSFGSSKSPLNIRLSNSIKYSSTLMSFYCNPCIFKNKSYL